MGYGESLKKTAGRKGTMESGFHISDCRLQIYLGLRASVGTDLAVFRLATKMDTSSFASCINATMRSDRAHFISWRISSQYWASSASSSTIPSFATKSGRARATGRAVVRTDRGARAEELVAYQTPLSRVRKFSA